MRIRDALRSLFVVDDTAEQYGLKSVEWPTYIDVGGTVFPIGDYSTRYIRELPAVARGRQLIADTVAQLPVAAYRGTLTLDDQPAIVRRPDPDLTRQQFVEETILAMVDGGNAYWRITRSPVGQRYPMSATNVDPDDVTVQWNAAKTRRLYAYRGRPVGADEIVQIPLQRRTKDLEGTGPLQSTRLAGIAAALTYSEDYFTQAANPSGILSSDDEYTDEEAQSVIDTWLLSENLRGPRMVSGGFQWDQQNDSPGDSAWTETYHAGIVDIANILGIPTPLLSSALLGGASSIVYQNLASLFDNLWRQTLQPTYVTRIENAWSSLLPHGQHVQFNPNALIRGSIAERMEIHAVAIQNGIETVDEARAAEGLPPLTTPAPAVSTGPRISNPEA